MGNRTVKIMAAFALLSALSYAVSAETVESLPRHTTQANNMIRNDFGSLMLRVPGNPGGDLLTFDTGWSFWGGPLVLSGQASISFAKSLTNWLSVPIFWGVTGVLDYGASVFAGGGLILRNNYFALGLMGGYLIDENFVAGSFQEKNFDWAVYPVLNTEEYPFLGFLEKIYGYFFLEEPRDEEKMASKINYLLNLTFRRFLGLRFFEVYTRNGYNDFHFQYDLSNTGVKFGLMPGESRQYTVDKDGSFYPTTVYGLRVGGRFLVEAEYLTVKGLKTPVYGAGNAADLNESDIEGWKDYEYPFGLGGFPSVTFSLFDYEYLARMYIRFTTYHADMSLPFVPEIGAIYQDEKGAVILSWTFPVTFSVVLRLTSGFLD